MHSTHRILMTGLLLLSVSAQAAVIKPDPQVAKSAPVPFPFSTWDALLKKYVDDVGRVDYMALKSNFADMAALEKVYAGVAASSPKRAPDSYPTKAAREAYYIDAYNVCVWKNVLNRLPKLKSVDDEKLSFFVFTKCVLGGEEINLKNLESDIVRPQFKDARVHMALNCASAACPELPREAFTPAKLDDQLDREVRKFVAQKRNVEYDPAKNTLKLSKIFDWYKDDFGKDNVKVITWINQYRAPGAQLPTSAKIDYRDYGWQLNDPALKR